MLDKYIKSVTRSQSGYASFVITLVTIILISLLVVAFASITRDEQKNSLTNNLAQQAYYAAESGINDALAIINANSGSAPSTNNACAANGSAYISGSSNVLSDSAKYTCLIVNPSPSTLIVQMQPGETRVIPINNTVNNFSSINLGWQSTPADGSPTNFTGACPQVGNPNTANFPVDSIAAYPVDSCSAGVLQVDGISSTKLTSELASSNPYNSYATATFLEPTNTGSNCSGNSVGGATDNACFINCNSHKTPACNTNFPVSPTGAAYLKITDFYYPSDVYITITPTPPGTNTNISGSQVVIDSTGDANGQLKRLVERVCDNVYCNSYPPAGAIQSRNCIIKNFFSYPGGPAKPANPGGCTNT